MKTMETTTPQTLTERSIRRANRPDGYSLLRREDHDGDVHLRYTDGATCVIAPDGSFRWIGTERR